MRVGIACDQWSRKCAWVEVAATQISERANAVAVRSVVQDMQLSDQVAGLPGTNCVAGTGTRTGERKSRELVDQRVDLPAAENRIAHAGLRPPMSLAERQLHHAVDGEVMGTV